MMRRFLAVQAVYWSAICLALRHPRQGLRLVEPAVELATDVLPSTPTRTTNTSKFFLWLSDVHVDPYYGTSRQQCSESVDATKSNEQGTMGCDPPYALLKSVAAVAANLSASVGAEFFLFTGDYARHNAAGMPHPSDNVSSIIYNVTHILGQHLPVLFTSQQMSIGVVGNTDLPTDYAMEISTEEESNHWLTKIADGLFPPLSTINEPEFTYGGYFESEFGGLTVLTINTVPYSVFHKPPADPLPDDPFSQFQWLRDKLAAAAQEERSVWIVGHIPPGLESYGYTELWHPQYLRAYRSIVQDAVLGRFIAAQLFGHCHTDEFRLLPDAPEGAGPILLTSALSIVYNNNPSIRLVEYEPSSSRLLSYSVYWSEMKGGQELKWQLGYNAVAAYEPLQEAVAATGALSQEAFEGLALRLAQGDGEDWSTYVSWYKTQSPNDLEECGLHSNGTDAWKSACLLSFSCGLKVSTRQEFEVCQQGSLEGLGEESLQVLKGNPEGFYQAARMWHRNAELKRDIFSGVHARKI